MTPLRVPPSGSASRSPPSRGTQETNHSAFSQPPRPCREPAELGSAPGCYPCCSPVYHFAAEQMDDTEATFFSPSSGKMNLTKCCRHRPTRSHIHRNPEPLTEHRPRASGPLWGPGGRMETRRTFCISCFPAALSLQPDPSTPLGGPAAPFLLGLDGTRKQISEGEDNDAVIMGEAKRMHGFRPDNFKPSENMMKGSHFTETPEGQVCLRVRQPRGGRWNSGPETWG